MKIKRGNTDSQQKQTDSKINQSSETHSSRWRKFSGIFGNKTLSRMLQRNPQPQPFSTSLFAQRAPDEDSETITLELSGSVGSKKAPNYAADVITVQNRLNELGYLSAEHMTAERPADGIEKVPQSQLKYTILGIRSFQTNGIHIRGADGNIGVDGVTHKGLKKPLNPVENSLERIQDEITGAFEGGRYDTYNDYDKGIISYGKHQATYKSGTLQDLLNHYIDNYSEKSNTDYPARIKSAMGELDDAAKIIKKKNKDKETGKTTVTEADLDSLKTIKTLLKGAATDPAMQEAQDEFFKEHYGKAAKHWEKQAGGITTPLGHALFYDHRIQGSLNYSVKDVIEKLGGKIGDKGTDGQVITEKQFVLAVAKKRLQRSKKAEKKVDQKWVDVWDKADKLKAEGKKKEAKTLRATIPASPLNDLILARRSAGKGGRKQWWIDLIESGDWDLTGGDDGILLPKSSKPVMGLKDGATKESSSSPSPAANTSQTTDDDVESDSSGGVEETDEEVMEFEPDYIYGKKFYARAKRLNMKYDSNPTKQGWPYRPELKQLWDAGAYNDFADMVIKIQTGLMGISQADKGADGILGKNTAAAIISHSDEANILEGEPPASDTDAGTSSDEPAPATAVEQPAPAPQTPAPATVVEQPAPTPAAAKQPTSTAASPTSAASQPDTTGSGDIVSDTKSKLASAEQSVNSVKQGTDGVSPSQIKSLQDEMIAVGLMRADEAAKEDPHAVGSNKVQLSAFPNTKKAADIFKHLQTFNSETEPKTKEREKAAAAIADYAREQTKENSEKVVAFMNQDSPDDEAKTATLGKLAAAIGRTEFLMGTLFVGGSAKKHKWTKNRDHFVDYYHGVNKATAWCALWTMRIRSDMMGISVSARKNPNFLHVKSGAKTAWAKDHTDIDYKAAGGKFIGANKKNTSANEKSSSFNPWAWLRQELKAVDDGEREDKTKQEVLQDFFTKYDFTPQAGDIVIVRRSQAATNSMASGKEVTAYKKKEGGGFELDAEGKKIPTKTLSAYQSHTTTIEDFDGTTIHSVEGNRGGRVTGVDYDLSDPNVVKEIVFLMRPSVKMGMTGREDEGEANTDGSAITEEQLLAPVKNLNALLQGLATMHKYVEEADSDAHISDLVHYKRTAAYKS